MNNANKPIDKAMLPNGAASFDIMFHCARQSYVEFCFVNFLCDCTAMGCFAINSVDGWFMFAVRLHSCYVYTMSIILL